MKATGIVRKVDELGRIVLPIELRRNLNIHIKDPIEIFVEDDHMVLRNTSLHGSSAATQRISRLSTGKNVCSNCITELKSLNNSSQ